MNKKLFWYIFIFLMGSAFGQLMLLLRLLNPKLREEFFLVTNSCTSFSSYLWILISLQLIFALIALGGYAFINGKIKIKRKERRK